MTLCPQCSSLSVMSIMDNHVIHPSWSHLEWSLREYGCEFCRRVHDGFWPLILKSLPGLAIDRASLQDNLTASGTLTGLPAGWDRDNQTAISFRTLRDRRQQNPHERVTQQIRDENEDLTDSEGYVEVGLNYKNDYPWLHSEPMCQNDNGVTWIRLICGPPKGLGDHPGLSSLDKGVQYDSKHVVGAFYAFEFSVTIDVYLTKGDPLASFLNLKEAAILEGRTDKDVFSQIKSWRDDCASCHPECETFVFGNNILPGRLAKIASIFETGTVTVIEIDESFREQYAILSYCWGTHLAEWIETILRNQREGRPYDLLTMPQTIQDAIKVAFHLGYQYIWVDCLCILQRNAEDWGVESEKMGDIFENADLVISATATRDCHQGFLQLQKSRYGPRFRLPILYEPNSVGHLVFGPRPGKFWLYDRAVMDRAWCMQERLLGRRILHCLPEEYFFECVRCRRHESEVERCYHFDEAVEPRRKHKCSKPVGNVHDIPTWIDVVGEYCNRNITAGTDKLIAIAGLARRMHYISEGKHGRYLAGLWTEGLMRYLLWTHKERHGSKKQKVWRAPSWSWASMDTKVNWAQPLSDDNYTSHIKIIEASTATFPDRPFGTVQSAKIVLQGLIRSVPTTSMMAYWPWMDLQNANLETEDDDENDEEEECQGWYDLDDEATGLKTGHEIICLKLLTTFKTRSSTPGYTFVLILNKVGGGGGGEEEGNEWERIGLGRIFDVSIFDDVQEREICLV